VAAVTLLDARSLRKSFGGLEAVAGIDFAINEGEVRGLIGPNGAGKTTFVSLLAGRLTPDHGTITFAGEDITRLPAHARVQRGIAYTFQVTSIFTNLSVFENAVLAAGCADEARAHDALRRVGLTQYTDQKAGSLAYGHQRLLEVAMGLALRPRLLILDEPTQGLSDGEIENFIALVRDIATSATVLLIEHNMKVVMTLANRITVLNRGTILAEGSPDDIRRNSEVERAYLGTG
jgi:branched-chain amino acid transport system ATP-binding protein